MFIYYICNSKQKQTNNTMPTNTKHKGLRLRLRWQIAQRRRQRRRKERLARFWGDELIKIPKYVYHPALSVACEYDECAELKEYKKLLTQREFQLDIEKLTTAPANCSKCLIRQSLAELRALELRPKQPAK